MVRRLTVGKPGAAPFGGMLLVKSLAGVSDTPPEKSLAGKPFRESAIGWSLAGEWLPQYEGAELKLAAVPGENAVPAQLTLVGSGSTRRMESVFSAGSLHSLTVSIRGA